MLLNFCNVSIFILIVYFDCINTTIIFLHFYSLAELKLIQFFVVYKKNSGYKNCLFSESYYQTGRP